MGVTMGWGFSEFRHLFCFTWLMNKVCMYHNHIPLLYIFNSLANECWVSFSFKPPTATVVEQVPDAEIAKCSSWLEALVGRTSHTASLSATVLEASHNFMQKVILMFRSAVDQNKIEEMAPTLDSVFHQINSIIMEAQLMSHNSAMTATELCTHLHMLHRRTVLESTSVELPQRDKDRLMVMLLGGNAYLGQRLTRSLNGWKILLQNQPYWLLPLSQNKWKLTRSLQDWFHLPDLPGRWHNSPP